MQGRATGEGEGARLRAQRNLFAVLAVCLLGSMATAVPRKLASYRELKAANTRLVALQAAVADNQQRIRDIQEQILKVQREISGQPSP
jgi:hypothetical protein